MNAYMDKVYYQERVIEVAWRGGSVETNVASSFVKGVRLFRDGCWGIASSQGENININELKERALKNLRLCLQVSRHNIGELAEARTYKGKVILGKESDLDKLYALIENIVSRTYNVSEVIVTNYSFCRAIEGEGEYCEEHKNVVELILSIRIKGSYREGVGSTSIAFTGNVGDLSRKKVEELIRIAEDRASANARAKILDPFSRGKWTIILDPECSGTLFHELAHLLEADSSKHFKPGTRITTMDLDLYDDPLYPWSPSIRFFDDERVSTFKRSLVEDGVVIDLLHTRYTASFYEDARPGSSRGLFHVPKAMHTTLVVKPGDWRFNEIIEEAKKALLVSGVIKAELYEGIISIIPEAAWIIEEGELKRPVVVRYVKIPLVSVLSKISAMSRDMRLRYSYEKGHLVAEVSPYVRLEGYVE